MISRFLSSLNSHWSTTLLVYAWFRATVYVIDHAKKADLGRLLANSVTSTALGETLDEKLAALRFSHPDDCKFVWKLEWSYDVVLTNRNTPPCSESGAWWDAQGESPFYRQRWMDYNHVLDL